MKFRAEAELLLTLAELLLTLAELLRGEAAHHPLALKVEANASALSRRPTSSWDGKAAVFLLCGQVEPAVMGLLGPPWGSWGSWVLPGWGAAGFWVTAQLRAVASFALAAAGQFGSCDVLTTFPSHLTSHCER